MSDWNAITYASGSLKVMFWLLSMCPSFLPQSFLGLSLCPENLILMDALSRLPCQLATNRSWPVEGTGRLEVIGKRRWALLCFLQLQCLVSGKDCVLLKQHPAQPLPDSCSALWAPLSSPGGDSFLLLVSGCLPNPPWFP